MPLKPIPGPLPETIPGVCVEAEEHYTKVSFVFPRITEPGLESAFIGEVVNAANEYLADSMPTLTALLAMNRIVDIRDQLEARLKEMETEKAA